MEYVIDQFEKRFPTGILGSLENIPAEIGKVYVITNLVNDKVYVGQTWGTISHRWTTHKYQSTYRETYFYKALRKYGQGSFGVGLLGTSESREGLNNLEKLWIILLNSSNRKYGYNSTGGGEGGTHNKETSELLSNLAKERWANPDFRSKIIFSLNRPECVEKISDSSKKLWANDTHREEMAEKSKIRWTDPEFKQRVTLSLIEAGRKPEFKEKMSVLSKQNWLNSDYVEKRSLSLRAAVDSPDYRAKRSVLSRQMWEEPSFREKRAESLASPEVKARASEAARKRWSDPIQRENIIAAQNAGRARKKQNG